VAKEEKRKVENQAIQIKKRVLALRAEGARRVEGGVAEGGGGEPRGKRAATFLFACLWTLVRPLLQCWTRIVRNWLAVNFASAEADFCQDGRRAELRVVAEQLRAATGCGVHLRGALWRQGGSSPRGRRRRGAEVIGAAAGTIF
jgi:hypothetical protein